MGRLKPTLGRVPRVGSKLGEVSWVGTLYCLIEDLGRLLIFEKNFHRVALIRSGRLLIFYIFAFSYLVTETSLLSKFSLITSGR